MLFSYQQCLLEMLHSVIHVLSLQQHIIVEIVFLLYIDLSQEIYVLLQIKMSIIDSFSAAHTRSYIFVSVVYQCLDLQTAPI